jgi:thiol-disulfide isomerase/thioredoxin
MHIFYKILFLFAWIIVLSGCTHRNTSVGRAVITGKLTYSLFNEQNKVSSDVTLSVSDLILGKQIQYTKTVDFDGLFTLDVPVVSPSYASVSVDSNEYAGLVLLSPGRTTRVDLFVDETGKTGLHILEGIELDPQDWNNILNVNNRVRMAFMEGHNAPMFRLPVAPKEYADSMLIRMEKDLAIIHADSVLSENHKNLLYNWLKPFYLNLFFEYEDYMHRFVPQNEPKSKEEIVIRQKPEQSYYAFLRHFNLNNPPCLNDMYYSTALRSILSQPELHIPPVGDTPITDWLKETKTILGDLTGIDSGLFYDILAAEAYINQLWNELSPLSEQQKENILTYFSNPSFADILFAENDRTLFQLEAIEKNKQTNLVVNETPSVAKAELMNAILSKYNGKVVLVDFWATWCKPCLEAMEEFGTLKEDFSDKDVVFVYFTNPSSPKTLWEKKIPGIGGEHYYLNGEEWESISSSNKYGFDGIPTYLIFDKKGELKTKTTSYPGNDAMRKMIEELLL